MPETATVSSPPAHDILNQPPPFEDVNLFTADRPLAEALRREGAAWAEERVRAFGEIVGRRETIAWGFSDLGNLKDLETRVRRLVERLALALQASLLVRHAPSAVAAAFCASRLGGDGGKAFGTLPAGTEVGAILERALVL